MKKLLDRLLWTLSPNKFRLLARNKWSLATQESINQFCWLAWSQRKCGFNTFIWLFPCNRRMDLIIQVFSSSTFLCPKVSIWMTKLTLKPQNCRKLIWDHPSCSFFHSSQTPLTCLHRVATLMIFALTLETQKKIIQSLSSAHCAIPRIFRITYLRKIRMTLSSILNWSPFNVCNYYISRKTSHYWTHWCWRALKS